MTVDWSTLDTRLLRRYWAGHPEERRAAPPQLVDRVLIFHRGVEPARMQGYYYDLKIDALLSLCLLQPLWALLVFLVGLVSRAGAGVKGIERRWRPCHSTDNNPTPHPPLHRTGLSSHARRWDCPST